MIAGLAVLFSEITGKGTDEILFSGQNQLPGLVSAAGTYSVGALALIVGFKGVALSLGSFRGGPTSSGDVHRGCCGDHGVAPSRVFTSPPRSRSACLPGSSPF